MNKHQIELAEKTFLAMMNPYGSVEKTFPLALRNALENDFIRYIGIKNRVQIPPSLLKKLKTKQFFLHTLDKQSMGGRAVDIQLQNPVTGRFMTGSSSGTAVNVFLGINDLGIGTDGGGSVLAPALSLNLYGFISRLICEEELKQFPRGRSTDGISFQSSIGFMSRDLGTMKEALEAALPLDRWELEDHKIRVCAQTGLENMLMKAQGNVQMDFCKFPSFSAPRTEQLEFLKEKLKTYDVVSGLEGPVDVWGMGDTVFGHFDENTQRLQAKGCKGLIKVANMADASALVIPGAGLASGYILIAGSDVDSVRKLFSLAAVFPAEEDELTRRYFRDLKKYIPVEYGHFQ